jgi:hypothetical protein
MNKKKAKIKRSKSISIDDSDLGLSLLSSSLYNQQSITNSDEPIESKKSQDAKDIQTSEIFQKTERGIFHKDYLAFDFIPTGYNKKPILAK